MTFNKESLYDVGILRIYENAKFSIVGEGYDKIRWYDDRPLPSKQELEAEIDKYIDEMPMRVLREVRNSMLAATDWLALQDRTMTQEHKDFRQAVRDMPKNNPNVTLDDNGNLQNVNFPAIPEELNLRWRDFQNPQD